jgi:hypothetical protein
VACSGTALALTLINSISSLRLSLGIIYSWNKFLQRYRFNSLQLKSTSQPKKLTNEQSCACARRHPLLY